MPVSSDILILAPMAGFTDAPMRILCRRLGADFTVSEMVSAAALCYGDRKTAPLAAITEEDAPAAVQLFGHDPAQMEEAAGRIVSGMYEGCCTGVFPTAIDINMGCPVRKIVTSGDGSALMKNPALCGDLVRAAVRGAKSVPVTVKIRSGWDARSINAVEVALACAEAGAKMICVHGRTREQMYAPSADWSVIAAVRAAVPQDIPVIGNGDITSAASYRQMIAETGAQGAAIGREAMGNPWVFAEIRAALAGQAFTPPDDAECRRTAVQLARDVVAWQIRHGGTEAQAIRECRGRCAHFVRGSRGAAAIRAEVHRADTLADIENALGGPM